MRTGIPISALLLVAAFAQADEPEFSGPQPGEKLTACKVQGVFGPQAGKEFELIAGLKGAPTLLVFIHEWTRPGLQLIRPLDHFGSQWGKDGLAVHFVMLTADRSKAEQFLQTAKNGLNLQSPVSISLDGLEGPGNYGLNRKMTMTILLAKDNKVAANFAIIQPNETDAPKVLAAVAKLLNKPAPTAEEIMKAAAPRRTEAAPELQGLMRQMIQKDNDEAAVTRIAQSMVRWAGDDETKKAQLKRYCQQVVELGYGNDLAKKALKRLAGE